MYLFSPSPHQHWVILIFFPFANFMRRVPDILGFAFPMLLTSELGQLSMNY